MFSSLYWQLLMSLCCSLCVRAASSPFTSQTSPPYSAAQTINFGFLTNMTCDDLNDLQSGGTITVDDIKFIVPRNAMVITANQNVMWSEMWSEGVLQLPGFPAMNWEVAVAGNIVNGTYMAGIINILQDSTRLITGFINQIDQATGEFWIGGTSDDPQSGIRARINDPVGRYGVAYTDAPIWTADTDYPSITAMTGFPVCIQRPFAGNATDDPLCPTKNRPLRADGSARTMISFGAAASRKASDPDPNFFIPLAVGDYISTIGIFVPSSDGSNLYAVYNLIANIGAFTAAGELPVYLMVDRNQYAISGPALAEDGETRAVAFTTDVTAPITWYAQDLDPCTGEATMRALLTEQPLANIAGQAPGKTVFRGGTADFSPAPQWTVFKSTSGTKVTNNSIEAGINIAPISLFGGYIFAELIVYGDQMFPLEFQDMTFLAQGWGPYQEGVPLKELEDPPIIGQLDPFPHTITPSATVCAPTPTGGANGSASATATGTPHAIDQINILNVTQLRTRGETAYTVTAVDSVTVCPCPILTLNATSQNPIGNIQMVNLGGGDYTLTVSTKNAIDSISISSSFGGFATETF